MIRLMIAARLCFVVLFGTMAVVHGPVMTFAGAHAAAPTAHDHEGQHPHASHHAEPGCHDDQGSAPEHGRCNAFACFMAVEALPVTARPVLPILFAVMAASRSAALEPLRPAPALPPPRLQS